MMLSDVRILMTLKQITLTLLSILFFFTLATSCLAETAIAHRFVTPEHVLPAIPDYIPMEVEEAPFELPDLVRKPETNSKKILTFRLEGVQVTGNQSFSEPKLQAVIQGFIGKQISYADLEAIRQALTQFYLDAGYINSGVLLENQHINNGIVKFKVIEGKLVTINITGSERLYEDYIRQRIQFSADENLHEENLHSRFQLLLADPLIDSLNAQLRPGEKTGETILDIAVKRAQPYSLYLTADNYTPPAIGSYTGRLGGTVQNLTSLGDLFQFELSFSEGVRSIDTNFSIPINHLDSRVFMAFQYSHADVVEDSFKVLDIESNFFNIDFGLSHPVYRSLNRLFNIQALFSYRQVDTSVLGWPMPLSEGVDNNGEAKVSVIRLNQSFIDRSPKQVISLSSTFNIGIDAFNSTVHNDSQPDSQFFSWIGQAHYVRQLLDNGAEMILRANVQLSNDRLLLLEGLAMGGIETVRGYRENTLVRDEGYTLSLEFRYPLLEPDKFSGHELEIAPFVDHAYGWDHDNENKQILVSTGLGLLWRWSRFNASIYWAHAFTNKPTLQDYDLQDDGVHFQFTSNIF